MSKLLQGAGVVEWTAWLDQIRLAARTSIRTKKVGAGSKKWFDSEIRELHAAKVAKVAAVATAPPPERQLAVLKLEGLKRQLRSLGKSKKKATMVDVFRSRRTERSALRLLTRVALIRTTGRSY